MSSKQTQLTTPNTTTEATDEAVEDQFVPDRFDVEGASYEQNDGHTWLVDLPEAAGEDGDIEAAGVVVEKTTVGNWVVTLTALNAEREAINKGFLQPGSQVLTDYPSETKAVKNATALIERLADGDYGDIL
jgi:hypothetical protein